MLSARKIAAAKKRVYYDPSNARHQHDDCIRIAYQWLDAQTKTKGLTRVDRQIKHYIEAWGGRYVSESDVQVAAELLKLQGTYPCFNISRRLTLPSDARLAGIGEARTQNYKLTERHIKEAYSTKES